MNKLRAKYERGEEVKYISHLDTLRTFERVIRRAEVPIAYSQGFNPRPQMTFGLPLSVGVTSESEFVEFTLAEKMPANEIIERLNGNFPIGFKVSSADYIESKESLMSLIKIAKYKIELNNPDNVNQELLTKMVSELKQKEEIPVLVERKGKTKTVDIKSGIYNIDIIEVQPEKVVLDMTLSAGSETNIKPELVIKAINGFNGVNLKVVKVHRKEMLGEGFKELV